MKNHIHHEDDVAVALKYDSPSVPRVTAKGTGDIAHEIMQLARLNDIPLYENADLARLLSMLELSDEIPEALYVAVAEVLAFVYWLSGKTPDANSNE